MSTPALDALHLVAHEVGIIPIDPPSALASKICQDVREMQAENNELRASLTRANQRLDILSQENIP